MINNSKIYPLVCLVIGAAIISAGIYTLTVGELVMEFACYMGGSVVVLHGIVSAVEVLLRHKQMTKDSVKSLSAGAFLNACIGVMIILLPRISLAPIYVIFTIYIFVNAAIKLVDYFIDKRDNVSGRLKALVLFVFFLVFGVLMVFVPGMGKRGFLAVSGIYCIIYGAFMVWDFLFQCLPAGFKRKFRIKLSLPMPVLLSTMRPFAKFKSRQRQSLLDPQKNKTELKPFFPEGKETDVPPDMEVMIHISEHGMGIMGHCDICFEGKVYSYGSYDLTSTSLFGGIGDGIFVIGKREPYIRFYVTATPREIYGYGFRLDEKQKLAVRDEIAKLIDMAYPWETPLQQVHKNDPTAKGEAVFDWGSKMWNCTGSDFYKFKSGKMKTYFVVTSNCVMLADEIVRKACKDITPQRSVLTPGAYYDYLEHLLAMVGSPVFCRTIYNKDTTGGWSYTPRIPYSSSEMEMMTETEANRRAAEKEGKKYEKQIKKGKKNNKKNNL